MSHWRRVQMYYAGRYLKPRPHTLFYNPILACDCRCQHCGIWKTDDVRPILTPDDIRRIFSDPFFDSVETLWLLGGEPTQRDDIIDVLRAFRDALPNVGTITIGTTGVSPDRIAAQFGEYFATEDARGVAYFFHLSLDGVGAIHDRIRGKKGAFDKLADTVELLHEYQAAHRDVNIDIGLNCVIQPENAVFLDRVRVQAKAWNLPVTFNTVQIGDNFYKNEDKDAKLTLSSSERAAAVEFLDSQTPACGPWHAGHYKNVMNILRGGTRTRRCVTMESTMYVDPDGTVFPCPESYTRAVGSLAETGAEELWRRVKGAAGSVRKDLCDQCALGCSFGDGLSLPEWWRVRAAERALHAS